MNQIKALNQQLEVNCEDIESMIAELVDREEYICTGNNEFGRVCKID